MSAQTPPHGRSEWSYGIGLSPETVADAKAAIDKQQDVRFEGESHKLRIRFIRLRRLMIETQNLLADIESITNPATRICGTPISETPWFIVPHTNLFDGCIDMGFPPAKSAQLRKFLFGVRHLVGDALRGELQKIQVQLLDVFRLWRSADDATPSHRVILPGVLGEELSLLRDSVRSQPSRKLVELWADEFEKDNIITKENFDKLDKLQADMEAVTSGVLSPRIMQYDEDLKRRIDQYYYKPIDQKIRAKSHALVDNAIAASEKMSRLSAIFSSGEIYSWNSCPGLPNEVRDLHGRIGNDTAFRREMESLVGQIIDVVQYLEQKLQNTPVDDDDKQREKSASQVVRDARLLATIHVGNKVLGRLHAEGKTKSRQQIALVTNADRIASIVDAFGRGKLNVPVRHPRLMAATLRRTNLDALVGPMTIVAATLESFIVQAETAASQKGGRGIAADQIDRTRDSIRDTWRSAVTNLVLASRATDVDESKLPQKIERRMQEFEAEARVHYEGMPITESDRLLGLSILRGQAAYTARDRLFAEDEVEGGAAKARKDEICVTRTGDDGGTVIAIPVARNLRFAVQLQPATQDMRWRLHRWVGDLSGAHSANLSAIKKVIDLYHDPSQPPPTQPDVGKIMANRLALTLEAMAGSNWNFARALCSFAISKYEKWSDDERKKYDTLPEKKKAENKAEFEGEISKNRSLYLELLFSRQLALRGLAAKAKLEKVTQWQLLKLARSDIDRMRLVSGDDWRVRLSDLAFTNELLVFDELMRRDGQRIVFGDAVMDQPRFDQHLANSRGLYEDLVRASTTGHAGDLYRRYAFMRVCEFIQMTYLIVDCGGWASEYTETVNIEEFRRFATEEVARKFKDEYPNFVKDMLRTVGRTQGDGLERPYIFGDFMNSFWKMRESYDKISGALANERFGATDDERKALIGHVNGMIGEMEMMRAIVHKMSSDGFVRWVSQEANLTLLKKGKKVVEQGVERCLLRLLPHGIGAERLADS
jgi:hypothetical protein